MSLFNLCLSLIYSSSKEMKKKDFYQYYLTGRCPYGESNRDKSLKVGLQQINRTVWFVTKFLVFTFPRILLSPPFF